MSTNIGLTKSKLGQSSIKTTVSRSIAGAQRSTGASSAMSRTGSLFGIYAQRTSKGSGRHFSYLGYNDEQTWALRHSLNDSRTPVFNNITEGYPHYHEDNSNKGLGIAMGIMAGLGFLGAVSKGITELLATDDTTSRKTSENDKKVIDNKQTISNQRLSKQLKSADSFTDINSVEASMNEQLSGFGNAYKELGETSKQQISEALADENIKAGLEFAGVSLDLSALDLNSINLTDTSSIDDIESAVDSIDKDKEKVEKFSNGQLDSAISSLKSRSDALKTDIRSKDIQIQDLESKLSDPNLDSSLRTTYQNQLDQLKEEKAKLEADKKKVDDAQKELEKIKNTNIPDIIEALETKKGELQDLKETKASLLDKKYELAKEQDEAINNNKKEMDKLSQEIEKLRSSVNDPKKGKANSEKLKTYIDQYNDLAQEMQALYSSLKDAGSTEFKNSKNQKYTVQNVKEDKNYTTVMTPIPFKGAGQNIDSGLSGNALTSAILNMIDTCQPGQTIDIADATYTKGYDGKFVSDRGRIFEEKELKQFLYLGNKNEPESPFDLLNPKLDLN